MRISIQGGDDSKYIKRMETEESSVEVYSQQKIKEEK